MKCYNNCGNEVLENSEYTAFCCKSCWKEYNKIKEDEEEKRNTKLSIKELQRKCFIKAKELREERYKEFMTPVQGL